MSDLLKQGQALLSSATGGATGSSSSSGGAGSIAQNVENKVVEGYAEQGINAVEAQIGFDKDHKYDQYEQKGIQALESHLKK